MRRGEPGTVERVAAAWPLDPVVSNDRAAAIDSLGLGVRPTALVAAADATGAVLAAAAFVLAAWAFPTWMALGLAILLGGAPPVAVRRLPPFLVSLRRTRAIGDAVGLVGRLVCRLRLDPTLERAVTFAGRTGEGQLAASLARHERRARGRSGTGLDEFVAEWRTWDPSLERAVALLEAAVEASPNDREAVLERALQTTLDGTRDRVAAFVSDVRGPATALYAFGVLLPLALVGVLPAARVAGVAVPLGALVVLYDVVLPAGLLAAGGWLLSRRPVAFPPPTVDGDHPDLPESPVPAIVAGGVTGGLGWLTADLLVSWAGPLGGVGVGSGVALWWRYRPVAPIRERARDLEAGLPDAMAVVGRRVAAGAAVESAVAGAAETVPGATGDLFADASRVGRALRVDVARSFEGEHGALPPAAGSRTRELVALLALAAREGAPAGDVLVRTADHLADLASLEAEARRELSAVTDTLANTAVVFGPLVGGVTVAMAARLARSGTGDVASGLAGSAGAYPVADLGLAVGGYVLLLSAILTALATALDRGFDPALVGLRVGIALPTATVTYVVAVVAGGLLV